MSDTQDELLLRYSEARERIAALEAENAELREAVANRQHALDRTSEDYEALYGLAEDMIACAGGSGAQPCVSWAREKLRAYGVEVEA